jgi:hypothetical protein
MNDIRQRIKETELNIKNWYRNPDESESVSNYFLKEEKKYLRYLKMKLNESSKDRIKRLMDSIECFK